MSFGLPERTVCKIPIKKRDASLKRMSPSWRQHFTKDLRSMHWRHKLVPELINVSAGKKVKEVHLFELELRDEAKVGAEFLLGIDRVLPYHFIFVLSRGERVQVWMSHKEVSTDGKIRVLKATDYIHTDWMPCEELKFTIEGFTMDEVYESLVRQVAALAGYDWQPQLSIAANLERGRVRTKLARQITALTHKIAQTKQFNRRIELRDELGKLQEEYENLK